MQTPMPVSRARRESLVHRERNLKVGRITPSGVVTEFALPEPADPQDIASGIDGTLWVTSGASIVSIDVNTGTVKQSFPLQMGSNPRGIAAGPDGRLWFAEYGTGQIGSIVALQPA
jgi:virginiamycin B lyase